MTSHRLASLWTPLLLLVAGTLLVAGCGSSDGGTARVRSGRCDAQPLESAQALEEGTVFQGGLFGQGRDGYPVFRIPSIVSTSSGVLVAFAEARQSLEDPGAGEMELVMKRSFDCGRTWTPTEVVAENGTGDAHNPTAVVVPGLERRSRVWLFYNLRPRAEPTADGSVGTLDSQVAPGFGPDAVSIWVRSSDDDGATWSSPRELTRDVKHESWRVASMGPGQAIVTRWGTDLAPAGRMVVPGWYTSDGARSGSWVMLSDDDGATWRRGGLPDRLSSESQAVELTDGRVVLDGRGSSGRTLFTSSDAGESWGSPVPGLRMPGIMASVLRYSAVRDGDADDLLLHSGIEADEPFGLRRGVRVWASTDEGDTWDFETEIDPGFAQYSVLTVLDDRSVGLLYESVGTSGGSVGLDIRFARFDLAYLGLPLPDA